MSLLQELIDDLQSGKVSDQQMERRLALLPIEEVKSLAGEFVTSRQILVQEEQLKFYKPVNPEARKFHLSCAKMRLITGGNRSGKSETNLVDLIIEMTGEVPFSLEDDFPKSRLRPPIRARLICQSLTNTWEPVIKPKLVFSTWNGRGEPGDSGGHWGWIPKRFLRKGKWEESWSEKNRTLTLTNGSTLQVNSYDQDVSDFAGASLHSVRMDEGPPRSIFRENQMRTIDTQGNIAIAMTPPDDESLSWDAAWIYDELYEKGLDGPHKDHSIDAFTFFTEQNQILDAAEIQTIAKSLSPRQREVRLHGRFMHLGGRVYPIYSDPTQWWCFNCNDIQIVEGNICTACESNDTARFSHIMDPLNEAYDYPIVYLLDPHPRKAHMMMWVAVTPWDDWWVIKEMEIDAIPLVVAEKVLDFEKEFDLQIAKRIIDPNMGRSQAHNAGQRHITVAEEFSAVGIRCDDTVGDSFFIGKNRLLGMLKPDPRTRQPRLKVFSNCVKTNFQMLRWTFDEWSRYSSDIRDPKQKPRELHSDFPTLLGYLANCDPSYHGLKIGSQRIKKEGRSEAY